MGVGSEEGRPHMKRPVKTLWVREPYAGDILAGRKTVEVRVGYENIRRLRPGDLLKLNDEHLVVVRAVRLYGNFEELVAREDPAAIAPDLPPGEVLGALRRIYSPEKEALGAVALELHRRRSDAVFFDMGYTLVYFEPAQVELFREALRTIGADPSVDQITAVLQAMGTEEFGKEEFLAPFPATPERDRESQLRFAQNLFLRLGIETGPERVRAFGEAAEEAFSRPGVLRPFPEAVEVLETLREQGYRLGIVSNWSWNLRQRVAQAGLEGFFEVVWASAYAGYNKPNSEIFRQALAHLPPPAVAPERALYIGDSYWHDVVGSRNAGLTPVLVDRAGTADARDCAVIRDLKGVFALLGD